MTTLVDAFSTALKARGGAVYSVTDVAEARAVVEGLCSGPAVIDDDPLLTEVCSGLARVDDPWIATIGVTTAVTAVAETGTLALAFDAGHARRTGLVPPTHLAVVPTDRLVETYADAIALVGALQPQPSGMRMVTGPSSSGDIEQVLVRGMHGPVSVHVVLVGATDAPATVEGGTA